MSKRISCVVVESFPLAVIRSSNSSQSRGARRKADDVVAVDVRVRCAGEAVIGACLARVHSGPHGLKPFDPAQGGPIIQFHHPVGLNLDCYA